MRSIGVGIMAGVGLFLGAIIVRLGWEVGAWLLVILR